MSVSGKSSSKSSKGASAASDKPRQSTVATPPLAVLAVVVGMLAVLGYFALQEGGHLTSTDPHPAPKVTALAQFGGEHHNRYLWGSYRPHVYFGLRMRRPQSLLFGMMWTDGADLLHICDQGHKLKTYGWTHHDGVSYGRQHIVGQSSRLVTEFLKDTGPKGGSWTARVGVESTAPAGQEGAPPPGTLVFFYIANEGSEPVTLAPSTGSSGGIPTIAGQTAYLGDYQVSFRAPQGSVEQVFHGTFSTPSFERLHDDIRGRFALMRENKLTEQGNVAVVAAVIKGTGAAVPVDISFRRMEDDTAAAMRSPPALTEELNKRKDAYEKRFEEQFQCKTRGYSDAQCKFAQGGVSNMIGGMGYFYGQSLIKDVSKKLSAAERKANERKKFHGAEPYFAAPLFTAVPSRSFFPRGFLWDEGFHQLLVRQWEPALTRDVLAHWLDLMNAKGWVPREQILGAEARSRVPDEFVVQPTTNANPPTWFLVIENMLDDFDAGMGDNRDLEFIKAAFPRLEAWFKWFDRKQRGPSRDLFRWRGRHKKRGQLTPLTLTSGLDDYPRSTHPSTEEYHVDLRCWMAVGAKVMARAAKRLGESSDKYEKLAASLSDNTRLDEVHWSDEARCYCDYGNHTFARNKRPSLQFVTDVYGYVSIFPFLLRLLEPTSPKLGAILADLNDTSRLWTPAGLRSLAPETALGPSPYYQAHNTKTDPPYWRGAIWMNINYLAVRALRFYGSQPGPHQQLAAELGESLRNNLIGNVFREYERTGYIWEQYDDSTGAGKGSHPFTGWSALVVAMMNEK